MTKETFLYVAESATYATGDQAAFRASHFLGCETPSNTSTRFLFSPVDKFAFGAVNVTPDSFTLTHTEDAHIEVLKAVASAMKKPGGFVVIQDDEGTAFSTDGSAIANVGFSDIDYAPIASTGTAVTVDGTGVVVATL
jgi:hypothetical protein|tara:strand:+ start:117 stop:530 length:414 start_codon:yes stop_codon:yes gene_type:complete